MKRALRFALLACATASCHDGIDTAVFRDDSVFVSMPASTDSASIYNGADTGKVFPTVKSLPAASAVDTKNTSRMQLVQFAQTQLGVPYRYAGTDPSVGFDCSGFITYVFNHFHIAVPRSSVDFTHVGKPVPDLRAQPGDLILFTGTDSTVRVVGHMGIVLRGGDSLLFIHSSSGRADGVTVSPLRGYYQTRFVKVIDVFDR